MSFPCRRGARRRRLLPVLLIVALAGCALPRSDSIDPDVFIADLAAREVDPRVALAALEQSGWMPAFARPDSRPSPRGSVSWWRERAVAYHPEVRRARRDLESKIALVRSAGSPEPIELTLETARMKGGDTEYDFMATFDLLGFLGLGRSAQAKFLAKAEVRAAYAMLEEATWRAMRESERSFYEVRAAIDREQQFTRLSEDLGPLLRRARAAAERGWISRGSMARAEAISAEIDTERAMAQTDLARRCAALASEAGLLPTETDSLRADDVAWRADSRPAELPPFPSPKTLLERVPSLRRLRLEHAVADAAVANSAAEQFPTLMIGPRLISDPMSTLGGLVAESAIAWPGAVDSRTDAAIATRARAKETLEDALLAASHNAAASRQITAVLHTQVTVGLKTRREAVDAWWTAAKGAFNADLARFEDALMSAEARMRLIQTEALLQLELAKSHSELDEALGPPESTIATSEGARP